MAEVSDMDVVRDLIASALDAIESGSLTERNRMDAAQALVDALDLIERAIAGTQE